MCFMLILNKFEWGSREFLSSNEMFTFRATIDLYIDIILDHSENNERFQLVFVLLYHK